MAAARVGGGAAIVAAPIFVLTIATGGVRQPGFDQWSTFVSELGATGSTGAAVTNAGFALVGACLGLFALGMLVVVPARQIGALLAVPAASFVVLAVSPCSAGCPIALVDAEATTADAIHNVAATAGLLALALTAVWMAELAPVGFGPRWYRSFCAAVGAAIVLGSATFGLAVLAQADHVLAVAERGTLVAAMAWNTVTGVVLLRWHAARLAPDGRPATADQ